MNTRTFFVFIEEYIHKTFREYVEGIQKTASFICPAYKMKVSCLYESYLGSLALLKILEKIVYLWLPSIS
jgi:hypothetical protein